MPLGHQQTSDLSSRSSAEGAGDAKRTQTTSDAQYRATFMHGFTLANLHRAVVTAMQYQGVQLPRSHHEPQTLVPTSYRVHA